MVKEIFKKISFMRKIKTAVIGVGNIGQHHVRVYSQLQEVELTAVCDLNKERALKIANKYKIRAFTDCQQLVKSIPQIEAVSIAVPTNAHEAVACFFLQNKINVLLEKPLANNLVKAKNIIDAAKKSGVKFTIGHVERFNPAVIKLKEIIKQGKLGTIISLIARRVGVFPPNIKNADVLTDLAVHDIDVINYLLDDYPIKVYKHIFKFNAKTQKDSGELFLIYKKASAFIQANWVTPIKIRKLAVTGTVGYAELDYISQTLIFHQTKINEELNGFAKFLKFSNPITLKIPLRREEPLKLEIQAFIENIINDTNPLVNGHEALKALEICLIK